MGAIWRSEVHIVGRWFLQSFYTLTFYKPMLGFQQCTLLEVTGGLSWPEAERTGEPVPVY